jgi:hypothetical protein
LPDGERTKPIEQTLIAGGHTASVTVSTVAAGAVSVALTVGTVTETFSLTAVAGDTAGFVARKLFAAINGSNSFRAINYRKTGASLTERTFDVISPVAFTITAVQATASAVTTAASPAKGATTIALPIPVKGKISAGQWLQFVDPNGIEYLAQLQQPALNGDTNLTVSALDFAIPAGSSTIFPVEFSDRKEASISESYEGSGFRTFNTDGFEDSIFTGASAEFSLGGLYNEFDAAYRTVAQYAPQGREFFAQVEYGNKRDGFSRPKKETIIMFTSQETPLAVDGLIEATFAAKVLQPPTTINALLED